MDDIFCLNFFLKNGSSSSADGKVCMFVWWLGSHPDFAERHTADGLSDEYCAALVRELEHLERSGIPLRRQVPAVDTLTGSTSALSHDLIIPSPPPSPPGPTG